MKKSISMFQIIGFLFTGIMGVVLHYLFDFTNQSIVAAPFCAVNESIWEHMKLVFYPMLVYAFFQSIIYDGRYKSFWCAKLIGITVGVFMIPVIYYTVNGAFGKTSDWFNIAIFYIVTFMSYFIEFLLLKQNELKCKSPFVIILVFVVMTAVFAVFTFFQPHIPLFSDPVTGVYGYVK